MTLTQAIKENANKMNLQLTDFMLDKILQVVFIYRFLMNQKYQWNILLENN